jgi:hypothetical protein
VGSVGCLRLLESYIHLCVYVYFTRYTAWYKLQYLKHVVRQYCIIINRDLKEKKTEPYLLAWAYLNTYTHPLSTQRTLRVLSGRSSEEFDLDIPFIQKHATVR